MQRAVLAAVLAPALGCSRTQPPPENPGLWRPSVVEPTDDAERAILRRLPELPPERAVDIDGQTVVAGAPYAAASGRTCRSLHITGGESIQERLVCREDGDWFFVPPVFQAEGVDASEP